MPTSCPLRNEYWIRPQVGVYGYTAYSATKFGLRGLAEALQHEVIMDNIHVTLIFPPDTDTPGLAEGLEYCLMLVPHIHVTLMLCVPLPLRLVILLIPYLL